MWEGWIEFIPIAGGAPLRTPRETTQPSHRDAVDRATGLTDVYLAGALDRALKPLVQQVAAPREPIFDEPAPSVVRQVKVPATPAIIDPFEVYENGGEGRLRTKLTSTSGLAPGEHHPRLQSQQRAANAARGVVGFITDRNHYRRRAWALCWRQHLKTRALLEGRSVPFRFLSFKTSPDSAWADEPTFPRFSLISARRLDWTHRIFNL